MGLPVYLLPDYPRVSRLPFGFAPNFCLMLPPSSAFGAVGHSIQFPDQKEPFAVPHNGKEVDAQPRVQVTNLAMAGAVVNGAVSDGMNAVRVKFIQPTSTTMHATILSSKAPSWWPSLVLAL